MADGWSMADGRAPDESSATWAAALCRTEAGGVTPDIPGMGSDTPDMEFLIHIIFVFWAPQSFK